MWYSNPLFGVVLTLGSFVLATRINKKTAWALFNPLLLAITFILLILATFEIPLEAYQKGGSIISIFVKPATVALAIPLYKNYNSLKKNFLPIIMGILSGVVMSLGSVLVMAKVSGLSEILTASILSKSITSAIAIGVTKQVGGIIPVAIACTVFTGVCGNMFGPMVLKVAKIEDKTAMGIALGTSSHVIGTSRAISMGEEIGAMSAAAIPIAGLVTVFLAPLIYNIVLGM